jgi:hypothetical protein
MIGPLDADDATRSSDVAIAVIGTDVTMSFRGPITGFDIGNSKGRAKNTVGNMPLSCSNARASPIPSKFRAISAN